MISVEEALDLVLESGFPLLETETLYINQCLYRCLANDIQAPMDLPKFRESSMDGFALCLHKSSLYSIVDEVKAGDSKNPILKQGECVRIFTGAVVPDTANAVIMQEKTLRKGNNLEVKIAVKEGQSIRPVGSQVKKGSYPLQKGHVLNAPGLAFLQSLGISKVEVFRLPKVSIILTGNELIAQNESLSRGKIYESNSILLKSALYKQGIEVQDTFFSEDNLETTIESVNKALSNSDVIIISGGISVGDYDFVKEALKRLDIKEIFYKVRQKPGKPLFFGIKEDKFIFALPGNPASTLTTFYVYVLPLLLKLKGSKTKGLVRLSVPISHDFSSNEPRALFLKASVESNVVTILDRQDSSMLVSFSKANALVYIKEQIKSIRKGDLVETLILPYPI